MIKNLHRFIIKNIVHSSNMKKILFVCHGNICRSTMAEMVMKHLVKQAGLEKDFYIDSAATSREEIGNGVHHGTKAKLRQQGIPCENHRARQITSADYEAFDLLIGMDRENIDNMNWKWNGDPEGKVYSLLSFAGSSRPIADPWYTGNFDDTYEDVMEGCTALLNHLTK